MSMVDILQPEIDEMSNSELDKNISSEMKFALENTRYRDVHISNLISLIKEREKRTTWILKE